MILVDVTRDFAEQARRLEQIDAVLLTHGHRDATGGLPELRRWWQEHGCTDPIDVFLNASTAAIIRSRYRHLEHCRLHLVPARRKRRVGELVVEAVSVPHARDPRFETYAWRISSGGRSLVYASDVAELTPELRGFSSGAALLILDGAMWGKRLFSHLTIDEALPEACRWPVESIVLTQIGRTAPDHDQLVRSIAALCAKARPAYDGLELAV